MIFCNHFIRSKEIMPLRLRGLHGAKENLKTLARRSGEKSDKGTGFWKTGDDD